MEIVTSWQLMGREEGREEGLVMGREETTERIVLRQLARRFGPLPEETEAAVRDLPTDTQSELALDLLDFKTPDDLKTWLAARR